MTPPPKYLIGTRRTRWLESRGIRPGNRVRRSDQMSLEPVPPYHAVTEDGISACNETGLHVFTNCTPWDGFNCSSRDLCPDCLAAVGRPAA